jgi:Tfp pilus assembly protein PilF
MSLAILTTALARAANIEIEYQLVNRLPVYQEYGSLIFNARHIRSVIYEPLAEVGSGVQIWRNKAVIDYYPSRYSYASGNVGVDKFVGMYYQNLAAEALAKDDFNRAFWLLKKSLEVDKDNAEAINSMAVLNRRVGDDVTAEELYKYGIKHADNKVSLLRNYHLLLTLQNRTVDAARVAKELEGLEDLNPFRWLHAANEAYDEADYKTAIDLYEKALEMAPYLHQGYFGIAKSEFQLGNYVASGEALDKAREEAFDMRAKDLYQAKLYALNKVRFN